MWSAHGLIPIQPCQRKKTLALASHNRAEQTWQLQQNAFVSLGKSHHGKQQLTNMNNFREVFKQAIEFKPTEPFVKQFENCFCSDILEFWDPYKGFQTPLTYIYLNSCLNKTCFPL